MPCADKFPAICCDRCSKAAASMSTRLLVSVGLGIVLRAVINTVCSQNDKLAGLLSGIWNGVVAHAAWRSDWLLEPLVIVEIVTGVCFDALFHGSLARLIALAFGCGLGVLFSDVAALHTLWDELDNVQSRLSKVEIKNDLDEPDVLSEFSDDVTYIYEEYVVTRRGRKMSTADWIAAQRKARSSKSTSRRASAFIDTSGELDKNLLLSGLDTQTQVTTQTQSTRARRDEEILASMTPLATRSVAKTSVININVEAPSSVSRMSSPTIKSGIKMGSPSVASIHSVHREVIEETQIRTSRTSKVTSTSTSSNHTLQRRSPSVKPEIRNPPIDRPSFIPFSPDRTGTSDALGLHHHIPPEPSVRTTRTPRKSHTSLSEANRSITDRGPFTPFVPPRPIGSELTTVPSSSKSRTQTLSRDSPDVHPEYNTNHSIAGFPSFVPFSTNNDLRSVMSHSRASSRRTGRFVEEFTEASFSRTESRRPAIRSKSSTRPASSLGEHEHAISASVLRSELSGHLPRERTPSPSPEVVIDYSEDTMRIHIPPPTQTGINFRIVPHAADNKQHSVSDKKSEMDHSDEQDTRSVSAKPVPNRDLLDPPNSFFGSLDLDTVPPDEERSADGAQPIPTADLSSDPQAPSIFNLRRAWRNSRSIPSASPSINYAGRIAESDDPPAAIIQENFGQQTTEFHIVRSPTNSASSQLPLLRRSRSAISICSYEDRRTPEMDKGDHNAVNAEVRKTPVVEWFGPVHTHNVLDTSHTGHSSNKRLEMLSSDPVAQSHHQNPTFTSSPSAKESILSSGPRVGVITRAQLLREQAADEEKFSRRLRQQHLEAQEKGQHSLAFKLRCEAEVIEEKARELHRRAERRFYLANNAAQAIDTIDVHRLKVHEAVKQVERALYAEQLEGRSILHVIVGRGKHSVGGFPILKNAIINRMTKEHHLNVNVDKSNPGLIHISLPSP